ncbi:hypothetical protein EYF80_061842 [Liparis tanakae]|uniref:Uncharacterized protein n=1 Tax=Liparis tanakae TaxID=230148 RepID=A0A4Z2EHH3_9TELE|nr:hypothetical protein EYF80_061842 [Liparis tanakae]
MFRLLWDVLNKYKAELPVEAPPPSLSDGLTSLRLQLQPHGRTHLQCRWIGAVLFRLRDVYSYFTRHEKPVRGQRVT